MTEILVPLDIVNHIQGSLSFRPASRDAAHALRYIEQRARERERNEQQYEQNYTKLRHKRALRDARLQENLDNHTNRNHERERRIQEKLALSKEHDLVQRTQLEAKSVLKTHKATGSKLRQLGKVKIIARTKQILAIQHVLETRSAIQEEGGLTLAGLINKEVGSVRAIAMQRMQEEKQRSEEAVRQLIEDERQREAELRQRGYKAITYSQPSRPPTRPSTEMGGAQTRDHQLSSSRPQTSHTHHNMMPSPLPDIHQHVGTKKPDVTLSAEAQRVERFVNMVHKAKTGMWKEPRASVRTNIDEFENRVKHKPDPVAAARRWLNAQVEQIKSDANSPSKSEGNPYDQMRALVRTAPHDVLVPYSSHPEDDDLFGSNPHNVITPAIIVSPELNDADFESMNDDRAHMNEAAKVLTKFMRLAAAVQSTRKKKKVRNDSYAAVDEVEKQFFSAAGIISPREEDGN